MQWRSLRLGFSLLSLGALANACGGTVADGNAVDSLRATGPDRCRTLCQREASCGSQDTCACGCACPANTPSCTCPPCVCSTPSASDCQTSCEKEVQDLLARTPGCAGAALAALDCLGSAACATTGSERCKAQRDAVDACTGPSHTGTKTTPAAPPPLSMGPVACNTAFAGGAAPSSGSALPDPCEVGWSSCSDGREYKVSCTANSETSLSCSCLVSGALDGGFVRNATDCSTLTSAEANLYCGWLLQ